MNRHRTTQWLLFSIALLLLINFVTMLLMKPAPARAQERLPPVKYEPLKYEVVSGLVDPFSSHLNKEIAAGWHIKFYGVTQTPTGSTYHVLLEK